jgi:hypothetical protein
MIPVPDPHPDFLTFPDPGSRGQKGTDPDSQHWLGQLFYAVRYPFCHKLQGIFLHFRGAGFCVTVFWYGTSCVILNISSAMLWFFASSFFKAMLLGGCTLQFY